MYTCSSTVARVLVSCAYALKTAAPHAVPEEGGIYHAYPPPVLQPYPAVSQAFLCGEDGLCGPPETGEGNNATGDGFRGKAKRRFREDGPQI